ncbi:MAG: hypothetical protein PHP31_09835 [Lentimicrobiaceae bacterium]|nr:hypothetical protein [Lentimicrobiaceae bacterium]
MKLIKKATIFFISVLIFTSCDSLMQVAHMANLAKCEFKLNDVSNLTLANVNFQNVKSASDISIADYARLTNAIFQGNLPLSFTLNVGVKNPNNQKAGVTALDWILFIDDIEMTRGILSQSYTINANSIGTIPVNMNFDLKQVLSGKSGEAVLNFAYNLLDVGNKPTRFMLKLKPTINVAGFPVEYPGGYFEVKTTFVSN